MDNSSRIARRVVVHGLVQAVGFRWNCARQADALQVTGWVRNLADGGVEAHFEGPAADVVAMVDWMREGPRHARVTRVEVTPVPLSGAFDFRVTG